MSRNINSTISSNISSTPSQNTSTGSIYRRVPSFLTESANSSLSDSDRILALAHRVAAISQLEDLERAEQLRRARDEQGETFKRFLAAEASFKVLSGLKPLRKTVGFSIGKRTTELEFLGHALGGQELKSSWLAFILIEEQERARRLIDQAENLKRVLAGKTSAIFMLGFPTVVLHSLAYIDDVDFLIEDASTGLAQTLEHGIESIVDSAKSFGNLALRAANFFGAKAQIYAPIVADKAQIAGEIALEKAQILGGKALEGAAVAGELAKEGALIAGAKAIEGAAIAGDIAVDLAVDGAHFAGDLAAEGAVLAKEGAQLAGAKAKVAGAKAKVAGAKAIEGAAFAQEAAIIAGSKVIEGAHSVAILPGMAFQGAKNLTAQAQDLAEDLWNGYMYTLSWSQIANLEEQERTWRMASLNSLDRFMIAMNVSSMLKDYIRINDATFYQPKRHYGTQVLEEFERIRRLLEFKSDKTARKNAYKSALLIKAQATRAKNTQRYDNWTAAQSSAKLSAPATQSAQAAAVVLPSALPTPASTSAAAAPAVTATKTTWGPVTRSQWAYVPTAQVGFTSYGSYKPATAGSSTWKPTPAAQLLQQGGQQQFQGQQAFGAKPVQVTQVQQTTTTSFTAAM